MISRAHDHDRSKWRGREYMSWGIATTVLPAVPGVDDRAMRR